MVIGTGIFFGAVIMTAGTVVASNAGSIPESACFIAMAITFFTGIGIVGKIVITASEVSGGN